MASGRLDRACSMRSGYQTLDGTFSGLMGLVMLAGLSYWMGFLVMSIEEAYPALAGLLLVALTAGGWVLGRRDGRKAKREAEDKLRRSDRSLAEAEGKLKKAETRETQAAQLEERADEHVRRANEVEEYSRRVRESISNFMSLQDQERIRQARELALTLEDLVGSAVTVGIRDGESAEEYGKRGVELVRQRTERWQWAFRLGHRLWPFVRRQGGLCGDASGNPDGKGCGCYLYSLPVTAVHLDHIKPRSKGGSDEEDNLQALCSACNLGAGARE